ncbi:hypothetical protein TeGR_g3868, partial [Tetraparma gracilis]
SPPPPPRYITVTKEQKKVHKETLNVVSYYSSPVAPYTPELLEESRAKLAELARADLERQQLEGAKNDVEALSYKIMAQFSEDEEELTKVSTSEQREEVTALAASIEDWLYEDHSLQDYKDKLKELNDPAEAIFFRLAELTLRPQAVTATKETLEKLRALMAKWEEDKPQVTEEERGDVFAKIEKAEKWIEEKVAEQEAKAPHEEVAFTARDCIPQLKPVETLVQRLAKKPKPKPPKEEKAEEEEEEEKKEGGGGEEDL